MLPYIILRITFESVYLRYSADNKKVINRDDININISISDNSIFELDSNSNSNIGSAFILSYIIIKLIIYNSSILLLFASIN